MDEYRHRQRRLDRIRGGHLGRRAYRRRRDHRRQCSRRVRRAALYRLWRQPRTAAASSI